MMTQGRQVISGAHRISSKSIIWYASRQKCIRHLHLPPFTFEQQRTLTIMQQLLVEAEKEKTLCNCHEIHFWVQKLYLWIMRECILFHVPTAAAKWVQVLCIFMGWFLFNVPFLFSFHLETLESLYVHLSWYGQFHAHVWVLARQSDCGLCLLRSEINI